LNKIVSQFVTPLIIQSQQLIYNTYQLAATTAGINETINMQVSNYLNMSIVFPKYDNDMTVFINTVYQKLQLIAPDLLAGLECPKEFEDSYFMDKNISSGTRHSNTLRNGTSFIWNAQLERVNAGYTFDGVGSQSSYHQAVLIMIYIIMLIHATLSTHHHHHHNYGSAVILALMS